LDKINEIGLTATEEAIKKFDTDGSPIKVGALKMTAKSKQNKVYQTLRYQDTFIKVQKVANLLSFGIPSSNPKRSNTSICPTSHKYSNMNAPLCLSRFSRKSSPPNSALLFTRC